ncbi:hypothetical protein GCM10029964_052180 [Kibdelosporangium lantanae]
MYGDAYTSGSRFTMDDDTMMPSPALITWPSIATSSVATRTPDTSVTDTIRSSSSTAAGTTAGSARIASSMSLCSSNVIVPMAIIDDVVSCPPISSAIAIFSTMSRSSRGLPTFDASVDSSVSSGSSSFALNMWSR